MMHEQSVPHGLYEGLQSLEDNRLDAWGDIYEQQKVYDFSPETTQDGHGLRVSEADFCSEGIWMQIHELNYGEGKDFIARSATLRPEEAT